MRKIAALGIIVGVLAIVLVINSTSQNNNIDPANSSLQTSPTTAISDVKASFIIFTNGTLRMFSDPKYHNLSPEVYIQRDNPSIIHAKKPGITWADFFNTLPMKLSIDCLITGTGQTFCSNESQKLKFYLNGQLKPNALEQSIKDGDQLLVSFGDEKDAEIEAQLQQAPEIK